MNAYKYKGRLHILNIDFFNKVLLISSNFNLNYATANLFDSNQDLKKFY